jgi:hypothetical protein
MKRFVMAGVALAVLAGCSTTDKYEKRAEVDRERREKAAERVIDGAPDWFSKPPVSKDAIYSVGDSYGGTLSGAISNARANAFEGICQAAGGTVRSQTKVYRQDTESGSTGMTTTAIRNMCPDVDVTGADIDKQKIIRVGDRYHAYVLVALPMGEANVLARTKQRERLQRQAVGASERAFRELDSAVENKAEVKPVQ